MQAKPLSEIEAAIESYVTQECGLKYSVHYAGETHRDGWVCDSWHFDLNGQSFDYFTGLGHRADNATAKRNRQTLAKVNRKSIAWEEGVIKNQVPQIPPMAGLLYSVISDMSASEQSFDNWCADFEYDTDSDKALKTYEACQENADKIAKVFNPAQINKLRELLADY